MAHHLTVAFLLMVALSAHGQQQDTLSSAERWYTTKYAPLYADKPWEHAEELAAHFTDPVRVHNETVESLDSFEWMSAALEEWRALGWTHSELADMNSELLNATTVAFKARWRDYYEDGSIAYECSWYLAGVVDTVWKISTVAGIDCEEHGLE